MDNIKVLEEIGLKRVGDETHIEQKYLKYMVDMNYDKLDRINTLGFVKILSREYKIDLDAWTEAFEEYWIENRKDIEDDGLFIVIDDKKSSKKLLIFIIIIFLGAIFGIVLSFFQDKIDIENYISNSNNATYEKTTVVQEVQDSLNEANNLLEENTTVESTTNEVVNEEILMSEDENITNEVLEDNTTKNILHEAKLEVKKNDKIVEKVNQKFKQEAVIVPQTELWVGIIYLDTKKRRSFLGDGNFSIDISREQIITTGHGSFDLKIGSEKREFRKQSPMRFLVKDSNLTEISKDKFKELNEGKSW